jgi:glycosyltransferase involved in cell wall biosynthesis
MSRVAILMPAYNEGARLFSTLDALRASVEGRHTLHVFLVDDGGAKMVDASALTAHVGPRFQVTLMRHPINMGQGAALETARLMALHHEPAFDAYVTMDSDGQHLPENLDAFVHAIADGADVAFGNRFAGDSNVPGLRRLVLYAARVFEHAITGLSLSDAHNGYRAFSRAALRVVQIEQNRMAHATEIKQRVAQHNLKFSEVPVSIRYTGETLQKGQSSLGALQIIRDLLYGYFFRNERRH